MATRTRHQRWYFAVVSGAGLVALAASLVLTPPARTGRDLVIFATLAAFVLLGELLPVRVLRRHDEVTVSSTFAYALLLTLGAPAAMLAHALASALADLRARKAPRAIGFNAGQVVLSLAAAGGVLALLRPGAWSSGLGGFRLDHLAAVLLAAITFFVVNNALVVLAQYLTLREPLLVHLRADLAFHAAIDTMLLGLVPIVLVVTEVTLWLLPLLALPIVAVYMSGRQAVINEHQATHDALTDLPNRVLFRDRASQAILHAQREGSCVAVMLMDLDGFKDINDTLGHHHGDLLLKRMGPTLTESLRSTDTIARFGGDEFAVLLPEFSGLRSPVQVASKLLGRLEQPFVVDNLTLEVGASVGIACYPDHGEDADTLIQRADVAMYWAKAGGTGFEVYSPQQDQHSPERLALVGELRRALQGDDEIVLVYQPKVDLTTGRTLGVEALVRWRHPQHGFLPPSEFIPIAERTGLIRPLTTYVLEGALREARGWREGGLDLTVAVNLSGRNLLDADLPDAVAGVLARYGVEPDRLEFEITESTIMADPVRATEILDRLSAMGIRLAIDDFGTGYSSLSQLKRLPVHEIKIDRSFVGGMNADKDDAIIVQSTIDLGRNLGLVTVAEGVEDQETLTELRRLGCDSAQGFFMSRPVSPGDLAAWMRLPASAPGPVGAGRTR